MQRVQMPSPPMPTGAVRFGRKCSERGVVARERATEPTGFTCTPFAQAVRQFTKRYLIVSIELGLKTVAGGIGAVGQIATVTVRRAGDLLGEAAGDMLHRDDMGRAQDTQHKRAPGRVLKAMTGQRLRCRRVEREPKPGSRYIGRGYGELKERHWPNPQAS